MAWCRARVCKPEGFSVVLRPEVVVEVTDRLSEPHVGTALASLFVVTGQMSTCLSLLLLCNQLCAHRETTAKVQPHAKTTIVLQPGPRQNKHFMHREGVTLQTTHSVACRTPACLYNHNHGRQSNRRQTVSHTASHDAATTSVLLWLSVADLDASPHQLSARHGNGPVGR